MENITVLREEINNIDRELVELFKKRMAVSCKIAEYKHDNSLPVYDPEREKLIIDRIADQVGEELADYASELYAALFKISRDYQVKILGRSKQE